MFRPEDSESRGNTVWNRLKTWNFKWAMAFAALVGVVVGIVGWGGFNTAMEASSSLEFCTSCHEMRDTVFVEYKKSIHYMNPAGVRATCPDCHVPKDWVHKVIRKVQATNELYHKVVGTISTPEKFEAHRLELARSVWASMKATDSRECRNCHSFDAMDFHNQRPKSAETMQKAIKDGGSTCIDCHKGIAHKLPDMTTGYKMMFDELVAASKSLKPSVGDTVYTLATIPFYVERPTGDAGPGDGKLLAPTPVKVVARDGDWLQVEVSGWQQQGAERMLYALQGKRIFVAALGPDAIGKVTLGPATMDPDTHQNWSEGKFTAWIKNESLVADRDKLWAYGGEMFNSSCGTCHSTPPMDHYLANQWIGTLNAMKRFVTLDDEHYRFLQKYMQLNAKDTKDIGATQ
jgi:trimethylamine-N-oxide reductase (cytochrome c), cytochrome c-type subunit TorC